jgi:rRNA maturation endonuclease Nob1
LFNFILFIIDNIKPGIYNQTDIKIKETATFTKNQLMQYKVSDVKQPVQLHTCRNCQHTFSGKICNQCGEKVFDEKQLSTKSFIKQSLDFFLH